MRCWSCGAAVGGPGPCPTCGALQPGQVPRSPVVRHDGEAASARLRAQPGPAQRSLAVRPQGRPVASGLGVAFHGAVAPVGARLGSFSIDATVVLLLTVAVAASTRSVALASVVAVETVVALVVWEARTGLTVGNAVLHLRTARDDRPWSPGAVRELARAAVVGAGALVGAVGAWVVVGSGGRDRTGRGRTWADRAGQTVVVRVVDEARPAGAGEPVPVVAVAGYEPPRAVPARLPSMPGPVVPGPAAPGPVPGPVVPGLPGSAAPRPRRLMVGAPPAAPAAAAPPSVVPRPAGVRLPTVSPAVPGPNPTPETARVPTAGQRFQAPVVPAVQPSAVQPARSSASPAASFPAGPSPATAPLLRPDVTVLLVLDTGQRDQLPFGAAAVLGRDPSPQVASDRTVVVRDDTGTVSKDHLRVEHTPDGVWLTDLGSTNGTSLLVDGPPVPLAPGTRTLIDGVVRVGVGQRVLMVSYMVQGGRP